MMTTDLAILFEQFINEREYSTRLSPQTVSAYKSVFRVFCIIMPEVKSAELLTADMAAEFFKRLHTRTRIAGKNKIKSGVKNSTVLSYWNRLKSFCTWLAARGVLSDNPFNKLKAPQVRWEDRKILSQEDIRKLYSAVTLYSSTAFILRRDTLMLSLLLFCGLRRNEFISLEVRDFDPVRHLITVRSETSKSGRSRVIPVHPTLLLHITDYLTLRKSKRNTTHYLITSHRIDAGLTLNGLKHWVARLCKKSRVSFHLHQLRHTFACTLAQNDVHAIKIQKLLGHRSLLMTMTYLRSIDTEDLKSDISKISI